MNVSHNLPHICTKKTLKYFTINIFKMDPFNQQFLTEYDDFVKNDLEQLSKHKIDLAADFDYSRAIKMFQDFLSGQTNKKEIPIYIPEDPDYVVAFLDSLKNEILSFPKPLILVMNQWKDVILLIDRLKKKPSTTDFFITVEIDSNTTIPDYFHEIPSIHVDDVTTFLSPNDVNLSLDNNQFHIIITLVDTLPLYIQKNQIFYGLNNISNFFDQNAVLFFPECKKLIMKTFEKTISLSLEDIQQCISYFQTFLNRNVYSTSQKNLYEISPRFIHVLKEIFRII
ncbi:hypothetical protein TRFO_18676 [Tritrichomonas foetus]|uniref:Uncharacterized protein n=1 Tax=Tritrichomonas foetus TaxID=1144522 RepID=A0A1J4KQP5_9EUKA|nr:hypothetical protein TRFO_18676 [Tritrichomonas foetus]|eukprot:OHT11781.1 hypothetical protein TRFO_18676 [Tritrichomonas foetus]